MKVVNHTEDDWRNDHPTGNIAFHHILKGDPESYDNFMYILGRQDGDFEMPRHRHNFDQIRLPIKGDMNLGQGFILGEGQVGYFAEGMPYGPQSDPLGAAKPGERIQLVLQFGGASGYGFMSIEQRRQAWQELSQVGKFVGPHFHHKDGRVEWGLNAVWRHVFGETLKYPRSRYRYPVIIEPENFNWLPVAGTTGLEHKYLGAFSERGAWIEFLRLKADSVWTSSDEQARRLFVVLSGKGQAAGRAVNYLTAIQADPGETLELSAAEDMELFLIGMPPIDKPLVESEAFDLEEMPGDDARTAAA